MDEFFYDDRLKKLSDEWRNCQIKPFKNSTQENARITTEIRQHQYSYAHRWADNIIKDSEKKAIENAESILAERATENVFRTAYHIAKRDVPFSGFAGYVELQKLNGCEVGKTVHSETTCAQIIDFIALSMRSTAVQKVLDTNSKVEILVNESTLRSRSYNIFLKTFVSKNEPKFLFLDIFEVIDPTANAVVEAIEETLLKHGFTDAWLQQNFTCFITDGSHYLLGQKSGIESQLKNKYPSIFTLYFRTAQCERGFIDMNMIIADLTNNLQIENVSNLLFIIINGPPFAEFDAKYFAQKWVKEHHTFVISNEKIHFGK